VPIYEFYSPDNNKLYSFYARTLSYRDKTPRCPDGEGLRMQRRVSRFAFIGKAKEDSGDDPFAGMDEGKMDAFMAEMERDMSVLDEDNPDPRQLGHFMRKLTNAMGDKVPEAMREMVKRLEAGEDPESLESQFGGGTDGEDAAVDALWSDMKKQVRAMKNQPFRDPKLYEFADFL
jgi:hypothetical protein